MQIPQSCLTTTCASVKHIGLPMMETGRQENLLGNNNARGRPHATVIDCLQLRDRISSCRSIRDFVNVYDSLHYQAALRRLRQVVLSDGNPSPVRSTVVSVPSPLAHNHVSYHGAPILDAQRRGLGP